MPIYTSVDFTISGGPSYSGDGTTIPTEEDLRESDDTDSPYNPFDPFDPEDDDDDWFNDDEPEDTKMSVDEFYDWWMNRQ